MHTIYYSVLYYVNHKSTTKQINIYIKLYSPNEHWHNLTNKSMYVYGRLPERLAKVQKCFLPPSCDTQISQCFITRMTQTNSDSEPIPNVPRNWWNSVPNRFRRNFYIPFRTVPKFESQFRRPLVFCLIWFTFRFVFLLIIIWQLLHIHSRSFIFTR